jgi:hypothetical protein
MGFVLIFVSGVKVNPFTERFPSYNPPDIRRHRRRGSAFSKRFPSFPRLTNIGGATWEARLNPDPESCNDIGSCFVRRRPEELVGGVSSRQGQIRQSTPARACFSTR